MCIAHTGYIMQILLIGMLQGHQLPPLDILFKMLTLDLFKTFNVDVCMPDMNRFLAKCASICTIIRIHCNDGMQIYL